ILLIESLEHTDCRTHVGSYVMLDRVTRVQAPVGDLGGLGGQIFRAQSGLGFAPGDVGELGARVPRVLLGGGACKHRRTQRVSDLGGPQQLAAWGMDAAPAVHGGVAINQPLDGCTLGSDDAMAVLTKAGASKNVAKPGEWMICPLGDGVRAFVTDH